jgi:putative transposase
MPETLEEGGMPRRYPPEFRRKVLDLIAAGRTVASISADLGVSGQTIYIWRNQDQVDRGERPGVTSTEQAELAKARRRIAQLETELAVTKRANELLKQVVPPKARFAAIAKMAEEGHPAEVSCRVLSVSDAGFYAWRSRAPSARAIRHAWLTDVITQVHVESKGTYGALRVHAELTMGRGITVGHNAVAMLIHRANLQGLPGARLRRLAHQSPTASDLVDRQFARSEPDQLWVTDITEHPTREGKVYCSVVLDVFSRRVVGWSIDASPTAALVTNALGMAIENRQPAPGALIHSNHGTQFTSWAFTRPLWIPDSSHRWARSVIASITPSSNHSGAGCR